MSRHTSGNGREEYYGHAASDLFEDNHDEYVADDRDHPDDGGHPSGPLPVTRAGRRYAKERARRRRRRRTVLVLALVVLVGLGYGAYQLSGTLFDFGGAAADYTGEGTGSVSIEVKSGDGAAAIGQTLAGVDVVKSADAFIAAAQADDRSLGIQPGVYMMRTQMSAQSALALLLDPTAKLTKQLVIREGAIQADVEKDLATTLGVPIAQVQAAAKQIDQIVPAGYLTPKPPTSLEGFLFPATYDFNPGTTPLKAFQAITNQFTINDRDTGFSDAAASLKLTPYQLLTAASIAQAELIFPTDAGKVTRVILNRIAIDRPLQVDPTSAYAAKIAGVDPTKIEYATYPSPYNTYLNAGLPPGPINSPGTEELTEAAHPEAGNWIYYVNGDAAGHLFFTADENAFFAAAQKCHDEGWGCADQGGG